MGLLLILFLFDLSVDELYKLFESRDGTADDVDEFIESQKNFQPSKRLNVIFTMSSGGFMTTNVCDYIAFGLPAVGKRDSEISVKSRDISITYCKTDLCNMLVMSTTSPGTSATTVHSGQRHCPRDILFIVDAPGSMGQANFLQMLHFIASVIIQLNIGVSESHVAVITFSSAVNLEWNFNKYGDKQALVNATQHIRYTNGETNTDQALQYAHTQVFASAAGDRQGSPNVAIVLTDGRSNLPPKTAIEVAALQHVAKVIAIGIGPAVGTDELHVIATDPDQQNVLLVRDFHDLQNLLSKIGSVLC